jgi:hypothetical protein
VTTIYFPNCRLYVDHEARYVQTVFEDGTYAPATPNQREEDINRARDLGYDGDTWEMTLDHELLHTWVPQQMGLAYSQILWNVAHGGGKKWPPWGKEEEGYVTSFQRYLRLNKMDEMVQGFFGRINMPHHVAVARAKDLCQEIRRVS